MLRRRGGGLYWTRRGRPPRAGLRGSGGRPVKIVERPTGRLVGTVDEPSSHLLVHTGAVYPHQGELYLVDELDLARGVALVRTADPGYSTSARQVTAIEDHRELRQARLGRGAGALRRRPGAPAGGGVRPPPPGDRAAAGRVPARPAAADAADQGRVVDHLRPASAAGCWTPGVDLPGAAHAAEHASIGLLPLFAACDRWDIGGVSADLHPATGQLTVFVYDGHEGGAGFAERGFAAAQATGWAPPRHAIADCECAGGLPVLHPVTQVRQRQRAAFQGRVRVAAAGPPAGPRRDRAACDPAARHIREIGRTRKIGGQRPGRGRPPPGGRAGVAKRSGPGGAEPGRYTVNPTCIRAKLPIGHATQTTETCFPVISSLAVPSSAEAGRQPAAAFFDLDKTIIAKSGTLAYGPSFYRNGLISRGDAVRSAIAQLLFSRDGASHDRMEQIRAHVSQPCRGWPAGLGRRSWPATWMS